MTNSVENAPNEAEFIEVEFKEGLPIALNGKSLEIA